MQLPDLTPPPTHEREWFPYEAVLAAFHRAGKHFVDPELLAVLDKIRAVVPTPPHPHGRSPAARQLAAFLDIALDKWHGRYDYQSYLALPLLALPGVDGTSTEAARRRGDRLLTLLLADLVSFECAAADQATDLLPLQRPDSALTGMRLRHALRAMTPAAGRQGLRVAGGPPAAAATQTAATVRAGMSPDETRRLRLSLLPVYVIHDEYLFIRVLQAWEAVFARVAVELTAAAAGLRHHDAERCAAHLDAATGALGEAAPLFSLLATMRADSFHEFREYTQGASAIQSRSYKWVEALCRTPDPHRLNSPAYQSVPEVRDRVLAGRPTIEGSLRAAVRKRRLGDAEVRQVTAAMAELAAALHRWRQTHYSLAVHMLGERAGTGYTEGPPYLAAARTIPVFHTVDVRRPRAKLPDGRCRHRHLPDGPR